MEAAALSMNDMLSHADRTRLVRLLGMLGSNHHGEVANAGSLADRLVRDRGQTWMASLASPVSSINNSIIVRHRRAIGAM